MSETTATAPKPTPKAKYRELKFGSNASFNKWLKKTAKKQIFFQDRGQDLTCIWIDEEGEILHANLQTSVWCGAFVNMETMKIHKPIDFFIHGKWQTMNFIVEEIN